ncbi:MAG: shikimate dehydrogenase [Pseudomonadota bacterium]
MKNNNKLAVIGSPISHSLSPRLHNFWLNKYNIDAVYEAIEVKSEDLASFLRSLDKNGFIGINITIPHKEESLKYVDYKDEFATSIGAINTIIVKNGKLIGSNTDAYGFIASLKNQQVQIHKTRALIIGAGGAAKAVCAGLVAENAELIIANRNLNRAEELSTNFGNIKVISLDEIDSYLNDISLLVNTTSLGMKNQPELEISLKSLPKSAIVTDIVYNPLMTNLLKQAQENGNKTIDGLWMLLYQAQKAFSLWFDIEPEVNEELHEFILRAIEIKI